MQTCRFKARDRSNDWKCCFCCHVRTGTVFFGLWHLMLHVMALSVLAVVLRHPELMTSEKEFQLPSDNLSPAPTPLMEIELREPMWNVNVKELQMPSDNLSPDSTPLKKIDLNDPIWHSNSQNHSGEKGIFIRKNSFTPRAIYYQDVNTCVVFTFCTFMITLMMVYGAIKGKPVYLLPFFCLQVFDFCLSSLSAIGFLLYMPDVHVLVAHCPRIPYQRELMQLSDECLAMLILLSFSVALLVKAYFIGVVWSCYKYLMLRVFPGPPTVHYIDTESLLPTYEAAVKKYPTPPPSYATATRQNPPPPPVATAATTATTEVENPPPQPM